MEFPLEFAFMAEETEEGEAAAAAAAALEDKEYELVE